MLRTYMSAFNKDATYHFHKYHALGNDYIVIDPNHFPCQLSKHNIQLICHRNFGVGSDGILYGPFIKGSAISFRIFNPDGSEAEKSGNGIRIFAQYLWDAAYVKDKRYELVTKGGIVTVELVDQASNLIKVDMGPFSFLSGDIPAHGLSRQMIDEELSIADCKFSVTAVNVGNPHCVIIMPEIYPQLAHKYGPLIEQHSLFPNRINVQFVKILDRRRIRIEIWERGAGYTMASGSSSSAAVSAAFAKNLVENEVIVEMPGGEVSVLIDNQHVHLTGTVTRVMKGNFAAELQEKLK